MYYSTTLDSKLIWKGYNRPPKLHFYEAQVVVWTSETATVQAIWCHDISVAWVRFPAREKQKNLEIRFSDLRLLD